MGDDAAARAATGSEQRVWQERVWWTPAEEGGPLWVRASATGLALAAVASASGRPSLGAPQPLEQVWLTHVDHCVERASGEVGILTAGNPA